MSIVELARELDTGRIGNPTAAPRITDAETTTLRREIDRAKQRAEDAESDLTEAKSEHAEKVGSMIGPYKLLQLMGKGGMGAVWMPAVQKVREAAAQTQCRNNLKQIGLALHNYESGYKAFPAAETYPAPATGTVSIHVALLPFIEQGNLYNEYVSSTSQSLAIQMPIPLFSCPDDPNATIPVVDGGAPGAFTYRCPVNYAFKYGTWFIYDWVNDIPGNGAFIINLPLVPSSFSDGMSNTLAAAEVKAQVQSGGVKTGPGYIRNLDLPNISDPNNTTLPANSAALLALLGAAPAPAQSTFNSTGSTLNCNVHLDYNNPTVVQAGFTTAFSPNTAMNVYIVNQNAGTGTAVRAFGKNESRSGFPA